MEQSAQPSSGSGPVHRSSIKFNSTNLTATSKPTEIKPKSDPQTGIVDVPLKLAKSVREKKRQGDHQWNCYRDCIFSQSMRQNYMNFKQSDAPARLLQWSDGAWVEISGELMSVAKSAFSERRPMVDVEVDGNVYILDFFRMLQVDVDGSLQRSIAWIDVNGDCFFPKFFVDESLIDDEDGIDDDDEQKNLKIEIEIKVDDNKNNSYASDDDSGDDFKDDFRDSRKTKVREGKFESEEVDTAGSYCDEGETGYSKRQRLMPTVAEANRVNSLWPNARLLTEGERSFSVVRDLFMIGMKTVDPGVCITNIHQLTLAGPKEKARFEAFHKQMETIKAGRDQSNIAFAWHGTSKKGVIDILAHGFGWSSEVSGPQAHGVGVYFSPARMSHESDLLSEADDNGEKHVLLCRVILGNIEKVEAGSQQFLPSSLNFDSGADDLVNPKWYIVWSTNMNTHILPQFIVSYKCSERRQGQQPKALDIMNWIPDGSSSVVTKLFSKLGGSLPASKLDELRALCMTFKAGRMPKDLFLKQLKSVVGSEVLRSAISQIQCAN